MDEMYQPPGNPVPKGVSYYFWEHKVTLSILLLIAIGATSFIPNGAVVAMLIALTSLIVALKRGSFRDIGFRKPDNWMKTIIIALILAVVIQSLYSILIDPLIEKLTGEPIDYDNFNDMRGNWLLFGLWLAIGWVIGGFVEEITFRGYMMTRIRRVVGENGAGTVIALFLTAIPFGLAHMYQGWSGVISTGSFGFIFGIIFVRNKFNIWLPIFVHGFVDMVGLTFIFLDIDRTLNSLLL